jgi:hypothetical protein
MFLHELVIRIRHAPKRAPCPTCGRRGQRTRILHRRLRTLAYHRIAWLNVIYAEYQAHCRCRKYLRTWPLEGPPKADYDASVRQAVGISEKCPFFWPSAVTKRAFWCFGSWTTQRRTRGQGGQREGSATIPLICRRTARSGRGRI